MDFRLPDEIRLLQLTIRRLLREEFIPLVEKLDPDAIDIPDEEKERLQKKVKALGLWGLTVPKEYGGAGLGILAQCIVDEELAKH
ncbi:MAG: acyl-CoA dehydrogenase family protein, partial [Candidatus Tectomicrobia bacterium]|nr:acyl-CoA dehydrogenase family protein [Candidatus Tectomicrobia bacterium]